MPSNVFSVIITITKTDLEIMGTAATEKVKLSLYQAVEAPTFFLDNRLTDGGEVVSPTRRHAALYLQEDSWYSKPSLIRLQLLQMSDNPDRKIKNPVHIL
jgi:hypothetical protein